MAGVATQIQMQARGPQDTHLTGRPSTTFFKYGYSQHTPFVHETVRTNFQTAPTFGGKSTAILNRRGDLLTKTYLVIELTPIPGNAAAYDSEDYDSSYWAYADKTALACISSITLEIGGVVVDAQPSEFMDLWDELSAKTSKNIAPLVGNFGADTQGRRDASRTTQTFYLPLGFFFSKHVNKGLPISAINRQDVRVIVQFRQRDQVLQRVDNSALATPAPGALKESTGIIAKINDAYLSSTVMWLDPAERSTFGAPYELLIDTLQSYQYLIGKGSQQFTASLDWLSHPVKELIFVFRQSIYGATAPGLFDYALYDLTGTEVINPFTAVSLYIQNQERLGPYTAPFCRLVTNYETHTNTPDRSIFTIPFALDPEANVPSGSCNFSALTNVFLKFTLDPAAFLDEDVQLLVFARGYNVLALGDGYATVRYAN